MIRYTNLFSKKEMAMLLKTTRIKTLDKSIRRKKNNSILTSNTKYTNARMDILVNCSKDRI
jgi:hypothetical protein